MGLWRYIASGFVHSLVVLFIVSIATFVLMHAVPGDPLNAVIGERQADRPEVRAHYERHYGLDKPLPVQYFYYVKNRAARRLGETITTRKPVREELRRFVPATMELVVAAMFFAIGLGVPLGIIAAVQPEPVARSRWRDSSRSSAPRSRFSGWGCLLAYLFSYRLQWLPRSGQLDVGMEAPERVTGLHLGRCDASPAIGTSFRACSGISSCRRSCSARSRWGSSPACCARPWSRR